MGRIGRRVVGEAKRLVSDYDKLVKGEERNRAKLNRLYERLSLCDRKIVDLEHDIEFCRNATMEEKVRLFEDMHRVMNIRRGVKDRISVYEQVELFYKRGADEKAFNRLVQRIPKLIEAKKERTYTKRVLETEEI